jgi:acyl-CoA thioester hydrolase
MNSIRVLAQMRWADIDALGHVHNAAFLQYFELARARLVFSAVDPPAPKGLALVVRRHEIDYLRPLIYRRASVAVDSHVARIGRSSLLVSGTVREPDDDIVYATVSTVLVAIDTASGAAVAIPDDVRRALGAPTGEDEA